MTKETFMIEEISKEIVWLLIQEHQMDMDEALRATLYFRYIRTAYQP